MTITAIGQGTISAPQASGFAVRANQFWLSGENAVLADGGPPGTEVVWNALASRIEFWIYGRLVTTIEAHVPVAAGDYQTNGLLDTVGRVFEIPADEWQTRVQSLPLEFDSLVGSWCVASYPGGETSLWVYANGNIRVREIYEFSPQARFLTGIWDAFGGLLHLSAEGVLTVQRVTETMVVYPAVARIPAPRGNGVARRISGVVGAGAVPDATVDGGARRTASVVGAGDLPVVSGAGLVRRYVIAIGVGVISGINGGATARRVGQATGVGGVAGLSGASASRASVGVTGAGAIDGLSADGSVRRIGVATGSGEMVPALSGAGLSRRAGVAIGAGVIVVGLTGISATRRVGVVVGEGAIMAIVGAGLASRVGPANGLAVIASPDANATGRRIGVLQATAPIAAPQADAYGRRLSHVAGAGIVPALQAWTRVRNPLATEYQLYRVVAITRIPNGSYQRLQLEALERPLDR